MEKLKILVFTMLFVVSFSAANVYAEDKVTGSASVGVFNRYVFRGYELSSNSIVIQPAISISYKGFSAGFWGNIDSNQTPTQSFVPDKEGRKSFNEVDFTISYTYNIEKLALTGGYIYYSTKFAPETEELFLSVSYDILTKPTLTIYRDIRGIREIAFSQAEDKHRSVIKAPSCCLRHYEGPFFTHHRHFHASIYLNKKHFSLVMPLI